jgi:BirA family transcriptional regulator, biotin operon repressor / biotin---[acetyl-CoA-carboxylase] ligase
VELAEDLLPERLAELLPGRAIRSYPALLSTHADALAWGRADAPEGAVVVADYQASPRGRAGLEWRVRPGADLAFSLVLRPRLPLAREGWLYTVAASGLADALGENATIEWPDEVRRAGRRAGAVGVHLELGPRASEWAVVDVIVEDAMPPRAPLLARVVEAIEARYRSPTTGVLADYLRRCDTIGRSVRARLIPLGPGGAEVAGRAATALTDGALVLETEGGRRIAVRPQNLGLLDQLTS